MPGRVGRGEMLVAFIDGGADKAREERKKERKREG